MATKAEIKQWFKTDLFPTQAQFWAWLDSYWHKDEPIPQSAIQGLTDDLDTKAEAAALAGHLNDVEPHAAAFNAVKATIPTSAAYDGTTLEIKAEDGAVLFSVETTIENIVGLQAALDSYVVRQLKVINTLSYTLTADDVKYRLQFNNAANQVLYIGGDFTNCVFECVQYGTGEVKVLAADGSPVTILTAPTEEAKTSEQYSVFAVEWQAPNTYLVYGKLHLV